MNPLHWLPIALMIGPHYGREMEGEYCDTETFRAECSDNEVIVMRRASYGRMKLGRCIEMGLGHLGCFKDVLHILDRRCSGKRVCEIRIPDAELESTRPCLKELKTYLDGSFTCQSVASFHVSESSCPSWNFSLTPGKPYIFLSNVGFFQALSMLLRSHTACFFPTTPAQSSESSAQNTENFLSSSTDGQIFAPGLLHSFEGTIPAHFSGQLPAIFVSAAPGQIINATLIDFAYYKTPSNITSKKLKVHHSYFQNKQHPVKPPRNLPDLQGRVVIRSKRQQGGVSNPNGEQSCRKYAYILDISTGSTKDVVVCQQRVSNVFVSKGHQVKLVMESGDLQSADGEARDRFIMKFEALGCSDPQYLENLVWFRRKSPFLGVMGCHFEKVTWSITCNDSHWSGVDRACPSATTTITTTTTRTFQATKSPRQLIRQTLQPPAKPLMGTSPNKNYSVQRFYEYYVDDASSRFYDAINEDEQRASFDLVASVMLIVATFILVVLIFIAIRRLKPGNHDGGEVEESPSSAKTTKQCQLLATTDGSRVLLSDCESKQVLCCGAVGANQLFPARVSSSALNNSSYNANFLNPHDKNHRTINVLL